MNNDIPNNNVNNNAVPKEPMAPQGTPVNQPVAPQPVQPAPQPVVGQQNPNPAPPATQPAEQTVPQTAEQTASQPAEPQAPAGPKYSFNSEEKVIYKMKEEKAANPIGTLIIIGILVAIVFFLPTISKKFGSVKDLGFLFGKTENTNTVTEEEETDKHHKFYEATGAVQIGDIQIGHLGPAEDKETGDYKLTFTIFNRNDKPYLFDKKYYITLYNDETLIYYALIYSFEPIGANASKEFSLVISEKAYKQANQFDIVEIEEGKYKAFKLNGVEGEYKTLTCQYKNRELKYYFKDDELEMIHEIYKATPETVRNYETLLYKYRNLSEKYRNLGLESHFAESVQEDSFTVDNTLYLKDIDQATLKDLAVYEYFNYHVNSKVVAFEMPTLAYTCS